MSLGVLRMKHKTTEGEEIKELRSQNIGWVYMDSEITGNHDSSKVGEQE